MSGAIACAARTGRPIDGGGSGGIVAFQTPASVPLFTFWLESARRVWIRDLPTDPPDDVQRWIGDIAVTMLDRNPSDLRTLEALAGHAGPEGDPGGVQ